MSAYIKLSTNEYPRHIGDIEIDPAGSADYAPVEWEDPPQFDRTRERLSEGFPVNNGQEWRMNWVLTPIPDSEQAAKVREQRNQKLKDTDWTQVADSPVDKAAWATYRQALRDVPSQVGFPWDVQWPTQPE